MLLPNFIFAALAVLDFAVGQNQAKDAGTQSNAEAVCKQQGPDYVPTYGPDGLPTGCRAPPKPLCFFGSYTDPKTGAAGCCGKDKGTFVTDPKNPKEGGCCKAPSDTYSFDIVSATGGCCAAGLQWTYDNNLKVGSCCPAGEAITCTCTKVTPKPVPTTCPQAEGQTFVNNGITYGLFCTHGWASTYGPGTWKAATDLNDCLNQCAAAGGACQGVNFWYAKTGSNCGWPSGSKWEYPPTGGASPNVVAAIPIARKP